MLMVLTAGLSIVNVGVGYAVGIILAILGGASGHASCVRARHHCLGRNSAGIDARSAEDVALDDRDFHSGARETRGHVRARLAGADDDRVVGSHDGSSVPACSATMYAAYHSGQFASL